MSPHPLEPTPRKGLAITSLVLGIASFAAFLGPFTGIPAILTGHVALRRARRDPAAYSGAGKAIAGLVLGYVSLLLGLPLMALVATLVMPQFLRMRDQALETRCTENLTRLSIAARQFAADHGDRYPTNFAQLASQPHIPGHLHCPADTVGDPASDPVGEGRGTDSMSYDLLQPGASLGESADKAVLRCPIHGTVVQGDGSTHPGKIGRKNKKKDRRG